MKDKTRNIICVLLLIFSIIVLVCVGVAIGFYEQILLTGFNPTALLIITGILSLLGIIINFAILSSEW